MMHAIVELAKRSVEEFIRNGKTVCLQERLPDEMRVKAGVFVCIKKRGELRGCVGTFLPCCDNVAAETIRNAISAATQDSRFPPVTADELDQLSYSVDVLSPPEKVHDPGELDPKEFGVIVSCGNRRGLLLPDLEGVNTVEEQLRITRMKACIMPDEEVEIFRFRVARYR
jgi:AmmeMemoRadiSam system protein A